MPTRKQRREADRMRRAAVVTTGRMPELLQDCDRKLSMWFASRPNARWQVRDVCRGIMSAGLAYEIAPL